MALRTRGTLKLPACTEQPNCLSREFREKSRTMACDGFCRTDFAYTERAPPKPSLIRGKEQAGAAGKPRKYLLLLLIVSWPRHTHGSYADLQRKRGKMRCVGKDFGAEKHFTEWGNRGSLSVKERQEPPGTRHAA